jgi:hypothetical protein
MIVRRLDVNGDMTFGQGLANMARDAEAVAQNVRTRLLLLLGEWFLDTSEGVPYLEEIFVKPENLPLTESTLKARIVETEGIATLESFELDFDRNSRKVNIFCTVTTIYGTTDNIRVIK